ncbi:hypothetical protein IWQ56_007001, partial [Coemansia nantahalensis]
GRRRVQPPVGRIRRDDGRKGRGGSHRGRGRGCQPERRELVGCVHAQRGQSCNRAQGRGGAGSRARVQRWPHIASCTAKAGPVVDARAAQPDQGCPQPAIKRAQAPAAAL